MRIAKNYAVIKVQCERFNSTYARLNPALGFESRISKYISGPVKKRYVFMYRYVLKYKLTISEVLDPHRDHISINKIIQKGDCKK